MNRYVTGGVRLPRARCAAVIASLALACGSGEKERKPVVKCPPGTKVTVHEWEHGARTEACALLDKTRHGPAIQWWPNGNKEWEGSYDHGKSEGPWVYYHRNGKKRMEGNYANDHEVGDWVDYGTDGQIQHVTTFDPNRPGSVLKVVTYKNGKPKSPAWERNKPETWDQPRRTQ